MIIMGVEVVVRCQRCNKVCPPVPIITTGGGVCFVCCADHESIVGFTVTSQFAKCPNIAEILGKDPFNAKVGKSAAGDVAGDGK